MRFKDIIGQEKIKKRLLQSVAENRVSHAQLIIGPNGVGKLSLAIAFGQYLSCTNRSDTDSCGLCPSCKKYEKLIHPDLHFVFPVFSSPKFSQAISDNFINEWREIINSNPYISLNKWLEYIGSENKQGIISTHESGQIIKKLNLKAFESEYKVMIIWMPEKMNQTASNKLLKMIEEPPPKTIFLLVSEDKNQLLKTIVSRTQIIAVPRIDTRSLKTAIIDKYSLSDEESGNIVRLSEGSYLRASEIISHNESSQENFERFTSYMRLLYQKDVISLNKWVDEIAAIGREKQKSFLKYAMRLIRDNFMLNQNANDLAFTSKEETKFSNNFSPFIKPKNIFQINEELNTAYYHIERNGYAKIVFFDLGLKLIVLLKT